MNKFFNKISLDLNPSFEGISKISECNFDKFEVAIFDQAGEFMDGDVLGWQSREDINKLIQIHA